MSRHSRREGGGRGGRDEGGPSCGKGVLGGKTKEARVAIPLAGFSGFRVLRATRAAAVHCAGPCGIALGYRAACWWRHPLQVSIHTLITPNESVCQTRLPTYHTNLQVILMSKWTLDLEHTEPIQNEHASPQPS
jgi:hypothetical protein